MEGGQRDKVDSYHRVSATLSTKVEKGSGLPSRSHPMYLPPPALSIVTQTDCFVLFPTGQIVPPLPPSTTACGKKEQRCILSGTAFVLPSYCLLSLLSLPLLHGIPRPGALGASLLGYMGLGGGDG